MNIIILGPQGSGKGTQARLIAERLNLKIIEAGVLVRREAKKNPKIGDIVNIKGQLIPPDLMFELIKQEIYSGQGDINNLILDGYPRSIGQYNLLAEWLKENNAQIDKVMLLKIGEKESIRRLSARKSCNKCGTLYNLVTNPPPENGCECGGELIQRKDDKPEAITKRLDEYKKKTEPMLELFKKEGILIEVDGERSIKDIFQDILTKLKK